MPEERRCRVCASTRLVEEPFGYRFNSRWLGGLRCRDCGIIFLSPQPTPEDLRRLYSAEYFEQDYRCGHTGSYFDDQTLAALVDDALLGRIQKRKHTGRFLEVGCAGGAFLDAARRRGYAVQGVEFSEDAAAFARKRFGLDVFTGDVLDTHFPDGSFDVVFMGDVIEHLRDPAKTLNEVHRIMATGGLLVLACPSQTNTLFTRCGFYLYGLVDLKATVQLPPYHLFEYRPGSLTFLLRSCQFEILKLHQSMIPPGDVTLRGPKLQRFGKKVFQIPNYALTKVFGILGDRLEVYAVRI